MRKITIAFAGLAIFALVVSLLIWTATPNNRPRPTIYKQNGVWAGYAVQVRGSSLATFVNGTWRVPQVTCSSVTSSIAVWVGLGGLRDSSLEQIGTRSDCYDGKASYTAFYELVPSQNETRTLSNFRVNPGDFVSASVNYVTAARAFQLVILDGNETYYYSARFPNSSLSSAEWVAEVPHSTRGSTMQIANFTTFLFSRGFATVANQTLVISQFGSLPFSNLYQLTYECANQTVLQAGQLIDQGEGFALGRQDGSQCATS